MDEAVNTLYETNSERSKTASSARNGRKGRSKMSACEMPSDYMTNKQKEALNGPVTTLNLSHFYSWDEFKAFSSTMQVEYLNYLLKKYHVGLGTISEIVFRNSNSALSVYCLRHDLLKDLSLPGKPVGTTLQFRKGRDQLMLDVQEQYFAPVASETQTEEGEEEPEVKTEIFPDPLPQEKGTFTSCQFTIDGFDIATFQRLKELFGDQAVELDIWVRPKENSLQI